jgi:hypothetical protein
VQVVGLGAQPLYDFQVIDVLAEGIEDYLVFARAWIWEAEGSGEVPGAETSGYAQGKDADVPEVGPADAGLEGEGEIEMRMSAGGLEGSAERMLRGRCEGCAIEEETYPRHGVPVWYEQVMKFRDGFGIRKM